MDTNFYPLSVAGEVASGPGRGVKGQGEEGGGARGKGEGRRGQEEAEGGGGVKREKGGGVGRSWEEGGRGELLSFYIYIYTKGF